MGAYAAAPIDLVDVDFDRHSFTWAGFVVPGVCVAHECYIFGVLRTSTDLERGGVFYRGRVLPGLGHWFQYSGTMPSCLFICLSVLLVSGTAIQNRYLAGLFVVGASCIQG